MIIDIDLAARVGGGFGTRPVFILRPPTFLKATGSLFYDSATAAISGSLSGSMTAATNDPAYQPSFSAMALDRKTLNCTELLTDCNLVNTLCPDYNGDF